MNSNIINEDELDIFSLLEKLWRRKLLVIIFMSISFFIGLIFIYKVPAKYSTRMDFHIGTVSPLSDKQKTLNDFRNLIFNEVIFNQWKKINKNSIIKYKS